MTVRELIAALLEKCASEKTAADVRAILARDSSPSLVIARYFHLSLDDVED